MSHEEILEQHHQSDAAANLQHHASPEANYTGEPGEDEEPEYECEWDENIEKENASGSIFFGADSDDDNEIPGEEPSGSPKSDCQGDRAAHSTSTGSTATPRSSSSKDSGPAFGEALRSALDEAEFTVCEEEGEHHVEIVSEEGRALQEALRLAQEALDRARKFVISPSLSRPCTPQAPLAAESEVSHSSPMVSARGVAPVMAPQFEGSRLRVKELEAKLERADLAPGTRADEVLRKRVNALHARFGESAAKARVSRTRSLEAAERERSLDPAARAEAHAKEVAAADRGRRKAAQRVASEQRMRREAQQQERQLQSLEAERRHVDAMTSALRATDAAERAESERRHRDDMVRAVLSDLHVVQNERRANSMEKARELQRRCDSADWSNAKPVVDCKLKPRRHPACVTPRTAPLGPLPPLAPKSGPKAAEFSSVRASSERRDITPRLRLLA